MVYMVHIYLYVDGWIYKCRYIQIYIKQSETLIKFLIDH